MAPRKSNDASPKQIKKKAANGKKKSSTNNSKETILVCSAHSDDFVIGAGGAIKDYVQKGCKVVAVVFSYGESSHPWLKESVIQKMREKEALDAGKILGCEIEVFNLQEFKFREEYKEKGLEKYLMDLIVTRKITKVFTHSNEDPHPDHKAVHQITLDCLDRVQKKITPEVYIYSVWNPVSFKTSYPSLYIDVSKQFRDKLRALRSFRSQKIHVAYPLFMLIYRAVKDGFKIGSSFGEHFFRIR